MLETIRGAGGFNLTQHCITIRFGSETEHVFFLGVSSTPRQHLRAASARDMRAILQLPIEPEMALSSATQDRGGPKHAFPQDSESKALSQIEVACVKSRQEAGQGSQQAGHPLGRAASKAGHPLGRALGRAASKLATPEIQ